MCLVPAPRTIVSIFRDYASNINCMFFVLMIWEVNVDLGKVPGASMTPETWLVYFGFHKVPNHGSKIS